MLPSRWLAVLLVSFSSIQQGIGADRQTQNIDFLHAISVFDQKRPGKEDWIPNNPQEQVLLVTRPEGKDIKGKDIATTEKGNARHQVRALRTSEGTLDELRFYCFERNEKEQYENFQILVPTSSKQSQWLPYIAVKINDLLKVAIAKDRIHTDELESGWIGSGASKKTNLKDFESLGSQVINLITEDQKIYPLLRIYVDQAFSAEEGGTLLWRYLNDGYGSEYGWFKLDLRKDGGQWILEQDDSSGRNPVNLLGVVSQFRYIFPMGTYEVGIKEVRFQKVASDVLQKI